MSRRALLTAASARLLHAQKAEVSSFDLSLLDDGPTPAELFFVREHFLAPIVSAASWKLSLSGAVAAPFEVAHSELAAAGRTLPVTLECAENPVGGGMVSHAEWTGVSLASLLERARPAAEAKCVRLSGADGFSRVIPISKAMQADTLIAHGMNGARLPDSHGFPARAIIPGWYGMDSVKWLRGIEVLSADEANRDYVRRVRSLLTGSRQAGPVAAIQVKSVFSRPLDGAILTGRRFILRGAAWAGERRIRQVEVRLDAGKSWHAARLGPEVSPYSWVQWSYAWEILRPGSHELAVRATDDTGNAQPPERPADRLDGYEMNVYHRIQVTVL